MKMSKLYLLSLASSVGLLSVTDLPFGDRWIQLGALGVLVVVCYLLIRSNSENNKLFASAIENAAKTHSEVLDNIYKRGHQDQMAMAVVIRELSNTCAARQAEKP